MDTWVLLREAATLLGLFGCLYAGALLGYGLGL